MIHLDQHVVSWLELHCLIPGKIGEDHATNAIGKLCDLREAGAQPSLDGLQCAPSSTQVRSHSQVRKIKAVSDSGLCRDLHGALLQQVKQHSLNLLRGLPGFAIREHAKEPVA